MSLACLPRILYCCQSFVLITSTSTFDALCLNRWLTTIGAMEVCRWKYASWNSFMICGLGWCAKNTGPPLYAGQMLHMPSLLPLLTFWVLWGTPSPSTSKSSKLEFLHFGGVIAIHCLDECTIKPLHIRSHILQTYIRCIQERINKISCFTVYGNLPGDCLM